MSISPGRVTLANKENLFRGLLGLLVSNFNSLSQIFMTG
uniref:Uncharacterized protein n=1 Tax=Rhizophora mucronata TaxID=61149 RepID=A0A2P2IJ92_RHIMU